MVRDAWPSDMTKFASIWVDLTAGMAVYAFLTLPAWLLAPMNRSTLWCLRDRVFDSRRRGELPDEPAVDQFILRLERFIVALPRISAIQLWWFYRKHMKGVATKPLPVARLKNDNPAAQRYFAVLQDELARIVLRQYLIGSWSGLLGVAPRHFGDLRAVLRRRTDLDEWSKVHGRGTSHWSDHEVVVEVENVVPHLGHRRKNDLITAAG